MSETTLSPEFEDLLDFVRESRGFDYSHYKRPSLMRRFEKRMQTVGVQSYEDYRSYLEAEPREFAELFDTILINVTGFFRDPAAWEYMTNEIVPKILEPKRNGETIRIWSAGCATGEEAYTAGILFAHALGPEAYADRVKIYATDLDDDALAHARQAKYERKELEAVPENLREEYFVDANGGITLRGDIRRSVIFGRNDLLNDPPISKVDLLISRNTLMYFGQQAQHKVLSNFYFALGNNGYLFLGKAEALHSRTNLFIPVELKHRVFARNPAVVPEYRTVELPPPAAAPTDNRRLRESSFDSAPAAQLVIDADGSIALANQQARSMFNLTNKDIGRPLQDLELSYRPLELRSRIDRTTQERRPFFERDVLMRADGIERHVDVLFTPLQSSSGEMIGVSVAFEDVTRAQALRTELENAKRELESAYEELQSTVEELETTNEELQSTNEELETTNEELQSTNEELETMNEELQSTNEELLTMNDELRDRTDEAVGANTFLSSVLGSIPAAVVVLGEDLVVTAWSRAAADLWGLRPDEAEGQFFLNLDIGLPVADLRTAARRALAGEESDPVELQARDRRGRPVVTTSIFSPLRGLDGEIRGVILAMTAEPTEEPS
jgi:two-component system, chemotaxis family, CheB/CheR fusion protein